MWLPPKNKRTRKATFWVVGETEAKQLRRPEMQIHSSFQPDHVRASVLPSQEIIRQESEEDRQGTESRLGTARRYLGLLQALRLPQPSSQLKQSPNSNVTLVTGGQRWEPSLPPIGHAVSFRSVLKEFLVRVHHVLATLLAALSAGSRLHTTAALATAGPPNHGAASIESSQLRAAAAAALTLSFWASRSAKC